MKYIITESRLESVILKYIDNQDLLVNIHKENDSISVFLLRLPIFSVWTLLMPLITLLSGWKINYKFQLRVLIFYLLGWRMKNILNKL